MRGSDCKDCNDCNGCKDCKDCKDCNDCNDCNDCEDCNACERARPFLASGKPNHHARILAHRLGPCSPLGPCCPCIAECILFNSD